MNNNRLDNCYGVIIYDEYSNIIDDLKSPTKSIYLRHNNKSFEVLNYKRETLIYFLKKNVILMEYEYDNIDENITCIKIYLKLDILK